jgi:hypothetical protein
MSGAFLLLVIGWVVFSTIWDGREHQKQKLLVEMRDRYSKHEALDLIYQSKHHTMIFYLAYGFLIGIAAARFFTHSG